MKIKTLFLVLFLLTTVGVFAQTTITGTVVDESSMPLPGAEITVQGKKAYAVTDFDGNFSLQAEKGDVLKITYLGFKTQQITVGDETNISITMQQDAAELDEVLVIGYGTQKKADVTGAVSSVKADELIKQPAVNATQSIQGKMSGVNIVNSNAPGASPNIIIRGAGTAAGGTNVLYVVDGVQVKDISNINPSDIESMNVLKDAASAAIYGMDAANGVIIITTKKGKLGNTKVSLSSYYGAKSMLNPVKMANQSQYITYFNERQTAEGQTALLSADQPYNTDWYDALTDVGFVNNNTVTLSGASEKFNYYLSYSNYNEDGILKNNDYARNTIRSNNSAKFFNDKLKVTSNVSASFVKNTPKPFNAFNSAYRQAPVIPVYYENGKFGQPFWNATTGIATYETADGQTRGQLNSIGNPVAEVYYANQKNTGIDLQGLFQADLSITDYLTATTRFAGTKSFSQIRTYNDIKGQWLTARPYESETTFDNSQAANPTSTTYASNSLYFEKGENFTYNWDTFLTFDKVIAEKHNVNALVGITRGMRDQSQTITMLGYNVPEKEQYWSMNFAGDDIQKQVTQTIGTPYKQLSYFGRLQYNYDSKYYFQANFRRDGVSTFKNQSADGTGSTDYYGNFPSFSAGWALSNEKFFENVKGINFLKLRAGWGRMGNSDVPFNILTFNRSTGSSNVNYVFGPDQALVYGASLGAEVYPISWEVTEETNIGLDYAFLNSRLTGAANYYVRKTSNAILNVTPLYTSETTTNFYDHGAELSNKGFEFEINWRDNIGEDFSYSVGATFSTNKNRVDNVKRAYGGQTGGSLSNGQITKRLEEGQPLYAWWMWEVEGVWQNQEEIDNNPHYGSPQPGYLRYKDQNGDGVIDDRDKKYFGSYLPTYNVGLNITLNYKNFDFSVDGFGAGGNKVYNALKGVRINGGENIAADVFNSRWTGEGSTNSNPGAARDSYASNYYLEDGDYFRVNAMTLGYTLRDISKDISRVRIYATAQNPFLFTKYSGFTPEISGTASGTGGIELSAYPNTKTFLLGVNVDL